jgi:hypothetical protein
MLQRQKAARQPTQTAALAKIWPIFLFWLSFLLLSVALFLPAYFFNRADSTFLPALSGDWRVAARQMLAWRHNLDPLRLNAELTLLLTLWAFSPRLRHGRFRRPFLVFLVALYLLALAYAIYETLSIFFYQQDPIFYAQAQLVVDGLPFVLRHLALSPAARAEALLGIVPILLVLFLLLRLLASERQVSALGTASRAVLVALSVLVLASLAFNYEAVTGPRSVVSCLACKIGRNVNSSLALAVDLREAGDNPLPVAYDYSDYDLLASPDIYLIFVESYGSILYRSGRLRRPYLDLLEELEVELAGEGWGAASILSESPTWGGGSWMAYTSALFGLRIDTHPAYMALRERFPRGGYPHLGRTLQEMGYQHTQVTSISVELDDEEWQAYKEFYEVDRWLRYRDLNYSGAHYGWGPAPPDQFVLGAANEQLQAASDQPLFLFTITQNSHYPWKEVPPVAGDWRALSDGTSAAPEEDLLLERVAVDPEEYLAAIVYELRFLTRFITTEAADDAIIILIGDHQPGYITRKSDGFKTPLHIISKDRTFLRGFEQFGFEPGLRVTRMATGMKHEGFYSLFMQVFLDRFGRGDRLPPAYLPDGAPYVD